MAKEKSILILYVCTGRYDVFWEGFYESAQKYFFNSEYTGGGIM